MKLRPHTTGGAFARSAVFDQLAFEYQDSGITSVLMEGCLDAPQHIPTGSVVSGFDYWWDCDRPRINVANRD